MYTGTCGFSQIHVFFILIQTGEYYSSQQV